MGKWPHTQERTEESQASEKKTNGLEGNKKSARRKH